MTLEEERRKKEEKKKRTKERKKERKKERRKEGKKESIRRKGQWVAAKGWQHDRHHIDFILAIMMQPSLGLLSASLAFLVS